MSTSIFPFRLLLHLAAFTNPNSNRFDHNPTRKICRYYLHSCMSIIQSVVLNQLS